MQLQTTRMSMATGMNRGMEPSGSKSYTSIDAASDPDVIAESSVDPCVTYTHTHRIVQCIWNCMVDFHLHLLAVLSRRYCCKQRGDERKNIVGERTSIHIYLCLYTDHPRIQYICIYIYIYAHFYGWLTAAWRIHKWCDSSASEMPHSYVTSFIRDMMHSYMTQLTHELTGTCASDGVGGLLCHSCVTWLIHM